MVAKYTIQRISSKFKPDREGIEKESLTLKVGENRYLKVYDEKLFDQVRAMEGATVGLDVLDSDAKNEQTGGPLYRYVVAVVPLTQAPCNGAMNGNGHANGNGGAKPPAPAGAPHGSPVQAPVAAADPGVSMQIAVQNVRASSLICAGLWCFNRAVTKDEFWTMIREMKDYVTTGNMPS